MQAKNIKYILIISLVLIAGIMQACKEEGYDAPLPSTQADFDYEVEVIVLDEEEGIEQYQVSLYNQSLLAQSLLWDFGNGETSTEENPVVTYTSSGKYTITLTVTPKNEVYYNLLEKSVSFAFGKQVVLFEDFNEGIDHIDEDTWVPSGWKAIDNDGDGYNWYVGDRQGVLSMRSQSFADPVALNPDNWLITPEVDLTNFGVEAGVTLRYTVGVTASTPAYKQEHYGIFIAVGNDAVENFELVFQETFSPETPSWTALERSLDISDYAGEVIYVAIRHFNVSDMDRIFFEEIELYVIE